MAFGEGARDHRYCFRRAIKPAAYQFQVANGMTSDLLAVVEQACHQRRGPFEFEANDRADVPPVMDDLGLGAAVRDGLVDQDFEPGWFDGLAPLLSVTQHAGGIGTGSRLGVTLPATSVEMSRSQVGILVRSRN